MLYSIPMSTGNEYIQGMAWFVNQGWFLGCEKGLVEVKYFTR